MVREILRLFGFGKGLSCMETSEALSNTEKQSPVNTTTNTQIQNIHREFCEEIVANLGELHQHNHDVFFYGEQSMSVKCEFRGVIVNIHWSPHLRDSTDARVNIYGIGGGFTPLGNIMFNEMVRQYEAHQLDKANATLKKVKR